MQKKCQNCPTESDLFATTCKGCRTVFATIQKFEKRTEPFKLLYDEVSNVMKDGGAKLSSEERAWLEYLIAAFKRNYEAWEFKAELRDYLLRIEKRSLFRVYDLIGHAYLHVAYDLPRVIADSHSNTRPGGSSFDELELKIPQSIDMDRARPIYLGFGPRFLELMEKSSKKWAVAGWFSLTKLIPGRNSLMRTFGYWVVSLRTVAWIHADSLREASDRKALEGKLLQAIKDAADAVDGQRWNPFAWLSRLFPPVLSVVPVLWLQQTLNQRWFTTLSAYIGGAVLLIIIYLFWVHRFLSHYADCFGVEVYSRCVDAMGRHEEENPSKA